MRLERHMRIHTFKQSMRYSLEVLLQPESLSRVMKLIFATRLQEVPKHMKEQNLFLRKAAKWRLKIGK